MRIRRIATSGLVAAALLTFGAGAASAATTEPCTGTGTGPAASLTDTDHDAFLAEMAKLKEDRDEIRAKYATAAKKAQRKASGKRAGRTVTVKLTAEQRAEKRAALAEWRDARDELFEEYGITARNQGGNA